MKYKIITGVCIILIVITAVGFESKSFKKNRYNQHMERPNYRLSNQINSNDISKEKFSTHLPLISIDTDAPVPNPFIIDENGRRKRNYSTTSAKINYYDNELGKNSLDDQPVVKENGLVRVRGRSSREFDKKGYLLKFKKKNLKDNKKVGLSNMAEESNWVLHGPYMDKTLIRNYLCYNLAGEIMEYSPNVRFCEMFLNGEYQGLYLLTEKVEYSDDGRINITETDPDLRSTSYILQVDVGSQNPLTELNTFTFHTGKYGSKDRSTGRMEIVYPKKTLSLDQKEYIERDVSNFEKALVSFDSADKKVGYPSFIDINSFVDYFIINEFTMNSDAGRLSTYLYKDIRGKMKLAVWDFNSAFDNYVPEMSNPHYFMMTNKMWYTYLLRDRLFVDTVVKRYKELRKTYLREEYLLNYIDETIEYLGPAIDRNYQVWGYSFKEEHDLLTPSARNPRSYEEAVQKLKDTVVERGLYLDENIETLYSISHDSVNKIFRERTGY